MALIFTALAIFAIVYVFMGVKIIRQSYKSYICTIEHFGRLTRAAGPGFNFVPPFFSRVGRKESGEPVCQPKV